MVARLQAAEQRTRRAELERQQRSEAAAAGKSESEAARRHKLDEAEKAFCEQMRRRVDAQRAAEERKAAHDAATEAERAEKAVRKEVRLAATEDRQQTAARRREFEKGRVKERIRAEEARLDEQRRVQAQMAEQRRRQRSEELRHAERRKQPPPGPGPADVDNRFFSLGASTYSTTGLRPKANGPAYSIGIRKEALSATPSIAPGPQRYSPQYELLEKKPQVSFGRKFTTPSSQNPAETPGPADVRAPRTRSMRARCVRDACARARAMARGCAPARGYAPRGRSPALAAPTPLATARRAVRAEHVVARAHEDAPLARRRV